MLTHSCFQHGASILRSHTLCVSLQVIVLPTSDVNACMTVAPQDILLLPWIFKPTVLLLQAKVEVCTEVPIKFHARLVAYLLSSDQVFKLQQWDPAAYVLTEDIVGSVAAATIMCNDQDVGESDGLYHFKGSSVFTFRGKTPWMDLSVVLFHYAV